MNCAQTRFLHTDQQGSIVAVANCWGGRTNVNAYDEYGIPAANGWGRYRYTGQAWLPELGMYYYRARVYSPTLGRFLQTDPIGYDDQVNLYAYVANDPINGRDPTGTEGEYTCAKLGIGCGPRNGRALQPSISEAVNHPIRTGVAVAVTVVAPELIAARLLTGAVSIRVGNALFRAGEAASTRLAHREILKAAQGTLRDLLEAKAEFSLAQVLNRDGHWTKRGSWQRNTEYKLATIKVFLSRSLRTDRMARKSKFTHSENIETGKIYDPKTKVQGGRLE